MKINLIFFFNIYLYLIVLGIPKKSRGYQKVPGDSYSYGGPKTWQFGSLSMFFIDNKNGRGCVIGIT